ncbi:MAG: DUF3883 domain-containing protein [Deltaproteobacteria bacterium]|nr:DUF3883 domain-containing protein [Deltaproteobacteria bacterium]
MKDWIKQELETVRETYLGKVLRMTGDYNREVERTKEYHGRQLLELLQNADDEAENTKDPSILIRLEENTLIIANNGQYFSEQGILSLMYSDNSPKIKRLKKIGYKGLGFRAILNWSDSIRIKSGPFSLEFSRENAISFLRQLLKEKPSLREEIDVTHNEKYPIATLAVPAWKDSDEIGTSEYDTYVVVNVSSQKVKEDIQNQINELGMEVSLFLNNLRNIKLESPQRNETIERVPPEEKKKDYEEIRLLNQDGKVVDSKKWRIFTKSDELPEHLRQDEMVSQYEYDLRIAVSEALDDDINRIFCFFKTEVKFPFPAIIHGTFDLDGNRNHLNKNEVNKFLLEELAELMIDTAKQLTQTTKQVNWDAMKLLAKKGEFDDKVEKMGFYDKLLKSMKSHKLIPVLSNKYMSVEEGPVFYKAPFANTLKVEPDVFHDLALCTSDEDVRSLLDDLGVKEYETDYFIEKLNEISESLSIKDRTELIVLIANNYGSYFHHVKPSRMPNLFVSDKGEVVKSSIQALLPPERSRFQLPDDMTITFVSNDLFSILKQKTNVKTSRALASKLDCFNIQEYRFDTVIRKIVTITNDRIKRNVSKSSEYIQKMLRSMFSIHAEDTESEKTFPDVNVPLLTRAGKIRNAKEVYFGREYSIGRIMDALYAGIDDTIFIAEKEDLGFETEDENKVTEFLRWIGVEQYPRINKKKLEGSDYDRKYDDYVLKNLTYPYTTEYNEVYLSYEKLRADVGYHQSRIIVDNIAELDDILSKANFEDISVWLHSHTRIQNILREGHESRGSYFGISLPGKHNYRELSPNNISSYILCKLGTTQWVKTRSGKKVTAGICCLAKTLIDMSPLIEVPAYNIKDEVFKHHNIQSEEIEHLLTKIGASRDFATLPTETIYAILSKLESADPEGKKARAVYRQIIESKPREWAKTVVNHEARKDFVEQGKLLAQTDGKPGYFPVKEVYYVDNVTFCKEIMHKFPIAQIDRRSGKEQVREVFGAKPLEDIRFSLASDPQLHPLNTQFAATFESFKPYILVFRLQKPTLTTELNQLKRLKIVLCAAISATYQFDDVEGELQLNPYEHIQVENSVYLLLDPTKEYKSIADLKEEIRFCESLAELITGILKVGENLKDYWVLFEKDKRERDFLIQRYLDDPSLEKLKQARELFHCLSDLQKDFWQCVLQARGSDKDLSEVAGEKDLVEFLARELNLEEAFLQEIYEGIYYEDYSSSSNLPYFKRLLNALKISIQDFNRHSVDQIDFTEHFESEITSEKYRLQKRYKSFIFELMKDKDIEEKERFVALVRAYENAPILEEYNINEELRVDKEKYFNMLLQNDPFQQLNLTYSALLQQEKIDLDKHLYNNKVKFEKRLKDIGNVYAEDIDSFIDKVENKSLLFFGEYDELVTRFENSYSRPPARDGVGGQTITRKKKNIILNEKEEEYEKDDYGSLLKNIDEDCESNDYSIDAHEPSRPPDTTGDRATRVPGSGKGGSPRKHIEEIGLLGEYYVYKALVKKYSADKVFWVSKYAKIAGVNPDGKDGEGYDIRYLDEDNQVHYVEVKSSSDDNYVFPISKPEVNFGEEHKSDYEIIFVLNVLDQKREFKNLENIFDYEEDESFNNNSKFTVENDGFKIRFE